MSKIISRKLTNIRGKMINRIIIDLQDREMSQIKEPLISKEDKIIHQINQIEILQIKEMIINKKIDHKEEIQKESGIRYLLVG